MINKISALLLLAILFNCTSVKKGSFRSNELISSKGEHIYVNTINWGVTDDNQISAISSNKNKLLNFNDTTNIIRGLEPFFYTFKNDSLILYFNDTITYKLIENFKTISVTYENLNSEDYASVRAKAYSNKGFYSVPLTVEIKYPSDMPKAP